MRNRRSAVAACLGITMLVFGQAAAQDSVSQSGCLQGDAVAPWSDAAAPLGSEQVNSYVVDADTFLGSWGQEYTIAPLSKSSKTSSGFFGSLLSSQGISRDMKLNVLFPTNDYAEWQAAGQDTSGQHLDE